MYISYRLHWRIFLTVAPLCIGFSECIIKQQGPFNLLLNISFEFQYLDFLFMAPDHLETLGNGYSVPLRHSNVVPSKRKNSFKRQHLFS